jgi:hypothetical protein
MASNQMKIISLIADIASTVETAYLTPSIIAKHCMHGEDRRLVLWKEKSARNTLHLLVVPVIAGYIRIKRDKEQEPRLIVNDTHGYCLTDDMVAQFCGIPRLVNSRLFAVMPDDNFVWRHYKYRRLRWDEIEELLHKKIYIFMA